MRLRPSSASAAGVAQEKSVFLTPSHPGRPGAALCAAAARPSPNGARRHPPPRAAPESHPRKGRPLAPSHSNLLTFARLGRCESRSDAQSGTHEWDGHPCPARAKAGKSRLSLAPVPGPRRLIRTGRSRMRRSGKRPRHVGLRTGAGLKGKAADSRKMTDLPTLTAMVKAVGTDRTTEGPNKLLLRWASHRERRPFPSLGGGAPTCQEGRTPRDTARAMSQSEVARGVRRAGRAVGHSGASPCAGRLLGGLAATLRLLPARGRGLLGGCAPLLGPGFIRSWISTTALERSATARRAAFGALSGLLRPQPPRGLGPFEHPARATA